MLETNNNIDTDSSCCLLWDLWTALVTITELLALWSDRMLSNINLLMNVVGRQQLHHRYQECLPCYYHLV